MKTIRWHLHIGLTGCDRGGEIEVADNATDEEIDEEIRDAVFEHIEWHWEPSNG